MKNYFKPFATDNWVVFASAFSCICVAMEYDLYGEYICMARIFSRSSCMGHFIWK